MKYEKFARYILSLYFISGGTTSAADYLTMHQDVTRDGIADQIIVNGDGSEFYTLSITSKGKEILKNKTLIPRTIKNSGGLDVFQGVSVTDKNISIRYRFCSPSKGVCYDRNIVSTFKEGHFFFLREEATANADKIAVSGVFYQRPPTPLESLSYQSLLENNDNAEKLFSNIYGSCVADQGGDSLTKISEALEKDNPDEWVLAKGCVTPALIFSLEAQEYLSQRAASRYFSLSQ